MKTTFHVIWPYREPGRNRIKRDRTVRERLDQAGIAYNFRYSGMGGGTYTVEGELPKCIARIAATLSVTHEDGTVEYA